jgi:GNAT superfamily N-acetyltransferase
MSRDLFQTYSQAARDAVGKGLNVPLDAFDNEKLTLVERPESMPWFTVYAVTFGMGTVLSIDPGRDGREFRNRFALVLHDAGGEPVAVAGAFDTYGMLEIGIDVVRKHRGHGFGRLAVSTLAREIMRRGEVPFYGCRPTNIRSHVTAESSGFRAVLADATVAPAS